MAALSVFILSLAGGFLFPWWWPALAAYGVGFWLGRGGTAAFFAGFAGTALAWSACAAFLDVRNQHLLSSRVAQIFQLPSGLWLLGATALLGGLLGGMGCWAGSSLRGYFRRISGADAG